jgi:hypothetical protein
VRGIRLAGLLVITGLAVPRPSPAQAPERIGATSMPALHGESIVADVARGTVVLVGGRTSRGWLSGTWEWDGRRWRQAIDSGKSPPPRAGHVMAYDGTNRRVVMFGGMAGPSARYCDTWTYDGARWTRFDASACITDRAVNASLVFDARNRRMLLADGPAIADETPRPLRLWEWQRDAWAPIDTTGPRRVGFSAAAFDEARGVLVVPVLFGGPDAGVWEWDGRTWTQVRAPGPSTRQTYGLAYDAGRRRVVLVGGQGGRAGPYFDDEWTWDGARWTQVTRGPVPAGRGGGSLLRDAQSTGLLYFGGYNDSVLADLWALDARGWRQLPR